MGSKESSLNGLKKFSQTIYFEDMAPPANASASAPASGSKKGRNGCVNQCQVEGCKVDLTHSKPYYSKHKVCTIHSKSPSVIVSAIQQRFCQQCSRFHQLAEFDKGKRSCRRRLAGHNERRRKPPPSSLLTSRFSRLSSSIFDNSGSFLMGFPSNVKLSPRNSTPSPRSADLFLGNQTTTLGWHWQGNSELQFDNLFFQGSVVGTRFPGAKYPPEESYTGVTDSSCALSLLSNQTWGSRNTGPSHGLNNMLNFNGTPMTQATPSHGVAFDQLPNNHVIVPDLGLGHISHPLGSQLSGELDLSYQ